MPLTGLPYAEVDDSWLIIDTFRYVTGESGLTMKRHATIEGQSAQENTAAEGDKARRAIIQSVAIVSDKKFRPDITFTNPR